jgi:hypothetical protein
MRLTPILALALALAASPAAAAPKVWNQDWSVEGKPTVRIRVDDAHVRVHRGEAGRVVSRVEFESKQWGLMFGSSSPVVVFERSGNEFKISARDGKGVSVGARVDIKFTVDVTVPNDVVLEVRSGDGAQDCEALQGKFSFESGDGAIRASGLKGEISVVTGDGRVTMEGVDGSLTSRMRDGHLTMSGRFDALDLQSDDGRQDVTAVPGSKIRSPWSLETRDGALSLNIPIDTAALLDARTRDGRLRVNLPIKVAPSERNELIGELNGGGPVLRLRTKDGSLTLGLSE